MKKTLVSLLVLLLLAAVTACGAQAGQPDEPEPAPQAEPAPEPLAEAEKTEISPEDLEALFEEIYTANCGTHPENWSVEFQITDEVAKITYAIPEDQTAPPDLRAVYTEWREARTEPEPEPEPAPEPEPEPAPQQPAQSETPQTNPSTQAVPVSSGSNAANGGSDSSDDWRQNMLTDLPGYIDPTGGYYLDPNDQRGLIGGSPAPAPAPAEPAASDPAPASTGSSGGTVERTPENNYGFDVPAGFHVELTEDGTYRKVNDETGQWRSLGTGDDGLQANGYIAGAGQLTVDPVDLPDEYRFVD